MPTYEYECSACAVRFERPQRITDPPLTECPDCHGPVRRLLSAGSGFVIRGARHEAARPTSGSAAGCSFSETGRTCCGRDAKCGAAPCESSD